MYEVKFIKSTKSKPLANINSYLYRRRVARENAEYWYCLNASCKACAKFVNGQLTKLNDNHNHESTVSQIIEREQRNLIKEKVANNKCLSGYIITLSNLPAILQTDLKRKICLMGGKLSKNLTNKVSHIVSNTWTSGKCEYARKFGLPVVMSPAWIDHCFRSNATQPINHDKFRLPIFNKFVICLSHVSFNL